jgi:hypothetical protein
MALSKPAAQAHLDQARENHRLYLDLMAADEHLDWALTLLFYTALQLAQAFFVERAATGFDVPRGHDQRTAAVSLKLPGIYTDYRTLMTRSEWARYEQSRHGDPSRPEVERFYAEEFTRIVEALKNEGVSLDP